MTIRRFDLAALPPAGNLRLLVPMFLGAAAVPSCESALAHDLVDHGLLGMALSPEGEAQSIGAAGFRGGLLPDGVDDLADVASRVTLIPMETARRLVADGAESARWAFGTPQRAKQVFDAVDTLLTRYSSPATTCPAVLRIAVDIVGARAWVEAVAPAAAGTAG